jgi:hypothetical protein
MAILEALKKWRHYFLGNKLIIKTVQSSLKYLASKKLLDGIQHKLMLKLLEFDYVIEYKKGIENKVADALSRKYQQESEASSSLEHLHFSTISQIIPSWMHDITESYIGGAACMKL